jgi:type 1 glutamine amidotransferase
MKRLTVLLSVMILVSSCAMDQDSTEGKMVLIYTRNGEGFVHDNIDASVRALEEICAGLDIETEVSDSPDIFTPGQLVRFDGIIFSNSNNEAFASEDQRTAFQEFIRSGRGFAGIHSSSGSERNWPWFRAMQGGLFLRHPPLQEFDISVIDRDHLSTAHLPDTWKWEDECYYIHHLNPDIHVLLAADLRTIEDDLKAEYPGTTFGDYIPLAWCHRFEGGRQWYTALGHKIEYYDDPLFREHLKGGILWILGSN